MLFFLFTKCLTPVATVHVFACLSLSCRDGCDSFSSKMFFQTKQCILDVRFNGKYEIWKVVPLCSTYISRDSDQNGISQA